MLSGLIHRASGARVVGLDLVPARSALARRLGLEAAAQDSQEAKHLLPGGAEIVVDSTGVPSVLSKALGWLGDVPWDLQENPPRTLVLQGSYGPRDIQIPLFGMFLEGNPAGGAAQ